MRVFRLIVATACLGLVFGCSSSSQKNQTSSIVGQWECDGNVLTIEANGTGRLEEPPVPGTPEKVSVTWRSNELDIIDSTGTMKGTYTISDSGTSLILRQEKGVTVFRRL